MKSRSPAGQARLTQLGVSWLHWLVAPAGHQPQAQRFPTTTRNPLEATTHFHRMGQCCTQKQTADKQIPQQELGNGEKPDCGAMSCGPSWGAKPKGRLVIHHPGDLHPSMTSGHWHLGSCGGAGPGADGLARGRCGEAGVTQHDSGRKMVKRESLKKGDPAHT